MPIQPLQPRSPGLEEEVLELERITGGVDDDIDPPLDNAGFRARTDAWTLTAPDYEGYSFEVDYEHDNGKVVHPLAQEDDDGNSVSVITVSPPITIKVVRFSCIRSTDFPVIPHPESLYPADELLTANVKLKHGLDSKGYPAQFQVTGVYRYITTVPWEPGDAIRGGVVPLTNAPAPVLTSDKFDTNFLPVE